MIRQLCQLDDILQMGLVARKPVFRVSDKTIFKPVSSAAEISQKVEISPVPSLHMILTKTRITKALISLRGCAGWSAPVLFTNPRRQVFSRCSSNFISQTYVARSLVSLTYLLIHERLKITQISYPGK